MCAVHLRIARWAASRSDPSPPGPACPASPPDASQHPLWLGKGTRFRTPRYCKPRCPEIIHGDSLAAGHSERHYRLKEANLAPAVMVLEAVDGERDQLDVASAELWTELSCSAEFSGADRSEVSRMREQDAPADEQKLRSLKGNNCGSPLPPQENKRNHAL